mmetsp:Transcript_7773/g.18289  ORF Transcript_7773/g.18289 Transcript_7773/m.18289 type:complete len:230 (-) Transcript_7773:431-1120(-)
MKHGCRRLHVCRLDEVHKAKTLASTIWILHGLDACRGDGAKRRKQPVKVDVVTVLWKARNVESVVLVTQLVARQTLSLQEALQDLLHTEVTQATVVLSVALAAIPATLGAPTASLGVALGANRRPLALEIVEIHIWVFLDGKLNDQRLVDTLQGVAREAFLHRTGLVGGGKADERVAGQSVAGRRQHLALHHCAILAKELAYGLIVNAWWQACDIEVVIWRSITDHRRL